MSRRAARENALGALAAALGTAAMAWLGLYGFAWNDYEAEARGAFEALVHGHLTSFLQLAPAYGGSLVLRAPFALLTDLWGGGELAVYRMVALPCLLSAAVLGVWLTATMRTRQRTVPGAPAMGRPKLARAVALGLCVANPLTLRALELGHPEELLGASLCVAAVLLAGEDRPVWAGLLLGAAVANKEWALLAIGPVLLALPSRRGICLLVGTGVAGVLLAPPALVQAGGFLAATRATAAPPSGIFQPWQVWWFLGHHGPIVRGLSGQIKPGYRTAPGWVGEVSHPLIVAVALPLSALVWLGRRAGSPERPGEAPRAPRRRRGEAPQAPQPSARKSGAPTAGALRESAARGPQVGDRLREALLLLALLMLLRCVLDIWDNVYYLLPFVLALTAWESLSDRGLPVLALSSTALAWIAFQWLPAHANPDLQAAFFLAWTLPMAATLAVRLYGKRAASPAALTLRGLPVAQAARASRGWSVWIPR
jgi:Glycosyltransferase family 87